MCPVLDYIAYTCIIGIKHPLSVCGEVNFLVLCLALLSIFPWSHPSISSEQKKKKKERTLKRPLSVTSWAFLVCWSLSKQAIRLLLSPPFKGFYLWRDRNDNIFYWASRKYKGRKVCVCVGGGGGHPFSNHATPFLSWKMNLWFEVGFEWCMEYKKKGEKQAAAIKQAVQRW